MISEKSPKLTVINAAGSTAVARKFNFTKKEIDKLPPSSNGQRTYYYDKSTRGLAIAVTPRGKKTFVLYRKIAGRPERIDIGLYPDLTIEQARNRADEWNGQIATGENPSEKQRKIRKESTLGELFDVYLEEYAKSKKRTWPQDVRMFNCYLRPWRFRKLSGITRVDVKRLHMKLRSHGDYTANRVNALLSSMYSQAREFGWTGQNPAEKIKRHDEEKRDRFLQQEELPAFFQAVHDEPNHDLRDFILLLLFTGARRGNVLAMEWAEISLERTIWRIPREKSKNKKPLYVYLSAPALQILQARSGARPTARQPSHALRADSPWVFPGTGRTGHLTEPKAAWARIMKRAGISDLRLHDLRRTLGSWQTTTGATLQVVGKTLGHEDVATTAIYARLNMEPVRAAVDKATEAMLLAAAVPGPKLLQ